MGQKTKESACTLGELAQYFEIDTRTLQKWLIPHLNGMIDEGWNPFQRLLTPRVVHYIKDKIENPTFKNNNN